MKLSSFCSWGIDKTCHTSTDASLNGIKFIITREINNKQGKLIIPRIKGCNITVTMHRSLPLYFCPALVNISIWLEAFVYNKQSIRSAIYSTLGLRNLFFLVVYSRKNQVQNFQKKFK